MTEDSKQPPDISPEESGVSPASQRQSTEIERKITETKFPQGPFGEHLNELSSNGATPFGGRVGTQITAAAFKQLEYTSHQKDLLLFKKDDQINALQKENTQLKVSLATSKFSNNSQQRASWIMAGIFALSTFLLGVGYNDWNTATGKVIFAVGCVCFLLGFFYPALSQNRNDDA